MAEEIEETEVEQSLEETIMAAMESKDSEPEEEVVAQEAAEEVTDNDVQPITPDEDLAQGLIAPDNWDADRKAAFEGLADEAAKKTYVDAVKSLEKGYQKKFDGLATDHKEYEQIVGLMSPFEAQLNAQGLSRYQGIQRLVGAEQLLSQNPVSGLSQLVQQYGGQNAKVIVQQLAQQYGVTEAANDESQAYVDPEIKALQDQVNNQNAYLQQISNNAQAVKQNEVNNQVTSFMEATDDTGNLLHPHFKQVEPVMAAMMSGGVDGSLDDLYQRAVRQDPDLWKGLLETERNNVAESLGTTRKAEVSASKIASRNVKTNNVAPDSSVAEPDDIRESIRRAMQASAV